MTLHETVYERNETLNRTSFFVFFFCCKEEKHETHRDAFSVVVVLIISSNNNSAFLSRSLRESTKSRLIYSFSFSCGDMQKQKENAQKNSAMDTKGWILLDESGVRVLLRHRPISRQRERSEAKFKKLKKKQTPPKRDIFLVKISLCKTTE